MPTSGTKGGRIETQDVCAICFSDTNIVRHEEIMTKRDLKGKNPLVVCRWCFDSGVDVLTAGGKTNISMKKQQEEMSKRKRIHDAVQSGRRKGRKM